MHTAQNFLLLVVSMSFGMLAACDDDEDDDNLSSLRVIHASPGAPAVDVVADGTVIATNLEYGQASPFIAVPEDDYNLVVRVAGTDTIVLEPNAIELEDFDVVTALITGNAASTDPADSLRVITLYDDFSSPDDGEARVRIVHASPDAPTIDIDVGDDGTIDIPVLQRFDDTGDNGVPLPSDVSFQLAIDAGGAPVTVFTAPALPSSGELYVIAIGSLGALPRSEPGFSLLVVDRQGVVTQIRQNPTVYVLHASPDAPVVDIRTDVAAPNEIAGLSFGELGSSQVPPGDYELSFFVAGDQGTTPVATAPLIGLAAGERYLAVATGMVTPNAGEQPFELLTYQDQFAVDASPRLRVIHVSPDAPAVDISTVTGNALTTPSAVRDLLFEESSDPAGLVVPATSSLAIGVAPTGSATALATFNLNTIGPARAFVLAAGALTPAADEQSFRLFQVDTAVWPWTNTPVLPN